MKEKKFTWTEEDQKANRTALAGAAGEEFWQEVHAELNRIDKEKNGMVKPRKIRNY